uniref:DNA-directed RNA polymerase n=1 Tax=viral metagenome TaxID=1070528 RepID=A0A6C0BFB1_9ZZZZ
MSSNNNFYDPKLVKELVNQEVEIQKIKGISSTRSSITLPKEVPWSRTNKKTPYANIFNNPHATLKLDPFSSFKEQEAARNNSKAMDNETKRKILIGQNTLVSRLPKYEVNKIKIYPYNPGEIRECSVVNINNPSKESGLTHGLFDDRMGAIKRGEICVTCNLDDKGCGGHQGYIELPEEIVLPIFKKKCILTLKCICPFCGDLYINEKFFKALNLNKVPKNKLLQVIAELSEKFLWKLHGHGVARHIYENDFRGSRLLFKVDSGKDEEDKKYIRSIETIKKMFTLPSKEKFALLGYTGETQPINFITDVITCAPSCIRPPAMVNGKPMDHPMTTLYSQILTRKIKIQSHTGSEVDRETQLDSLYTDIEAISMGPEKKNGVKRSLKESGVFKELGSKRGSVRGGLMGKRVDYNSRTVAGPGYDLNTGEIEVGEFCCKILTVPVIVWKYNRDIVIKKYKEGGYKAIVMKLISNKGAFTITENHIKNYTPEIGDILVRYIDDGDFVLGGRQPSLHAESILGFNLKKHKWSTVKIHGSNNGCFNADFDGDELTIHVLQTYNAMVEAMTVMNFKSHVMNIQSSRPMMGMSFHGLIGPFLATKTWTIGNKQLEVTIPNERWNEAISLISDTYRKESLEERLIRHNIPLRSGRALFSVVLPTNFTYSGSGLDIIDGIIVKGYMRKSNIGTSDLSLVQILAKMYSYKEACRFITEMQKLADWFTMWHGLSIGYRDFNINRKEIRKRIKKNLNRMQIEVFNLGPRPKDPTKFFFWMRSMYGILGKAKDEANKIGVDCLKPNNPLVIMGKEGCGAKGSEANTAYAIGSLGTQYVGSNIPEYELKNGTRCYPFFVSNDVAVESIGYIPECYMDGMNIDSSISHSAASRITLIDTAKNVSKIGYTHRRVEKSLEPIRISWLGTVTSTDGKMFQPIFGSGFDIGKSMRVKSVRSGERMFFCNFEDEANLLCRIYERKNFGDDFKETKNQKIETPFEKFVNKNGRRPRCSELFAN